MIDNKIPPYLEMIIREVLREEIRSMLTETVQKNTFQNVIVPLEFEGVGAYPEGPKRARRKTMKNVRGKVLREDDKRLKANRE